MQGNKSRTVVGKEPRQRTERREFTTRVGNATWKGSKSVVVIWDSTKPGDFIQVLEYRGKLHNAWARRDHLLPRSMAARQAEGKWGCKHVGMPGPCSLRCLRSRPHEARLCAVAAPRHAAAPRKLVVRPARHEYLCVYTTT